MRVRCPKLHGVALNYYLHLNVLFGIDCMYMCEFIIGIGRYRCAHCLFMQPVTDFVCIHMRL